MTLYLSRVALRRDPSVEALSALIDPDGPEKLDAHHRLIWSLFADGPERRRDFLWREDGRGRFYTLSQRPPDPSGAGLFAPVDTKAFEPELRRGDHLRFTLRANATRSLPPRSRGDRGERVDVVMHALSQAEDDAEIAPRSERRDAAALIAGRAWLAAQGESHGFRIHDGPDGEPAVAVDSYSTMDLPGARGRRKGRPRFGVLDLAGEIEVLDPARFLAQLASGFGRAKAFGCGLMLIRRA